MILNQNFLNSLFSCQIFQFQFFKPFKLVFFNFSKMHIHIFPKFYQVFIYISQIFKIPYKVYSILIHAKFKYLKFITSLNNDISKYKHNLNDPCELFPIFKLF